MPTQHELIELAGVMFRTAHPDAGPSQIEVSENGTRFDFYLRGDDQVPFATYLLHKGELVDAQEVSP